MGPGGVSPRRTDPASAQLRGTTPSPQRARIFAGRWAQGAPPPTIKRLQPGCARESVHSAVGVRRRMRAVEHPPVAEQSHTDARAFPLADLRSQFNQQRLDFPPRYVAADRLAEDQFERFTVSAPHG